MNCLSSTVAGRRHKWTADCEIEDKTWGSGISRAAEPENFSTVVTCICLA